MRSFFINRQYQAAIADCAMHNAFSIDRTTALTSKTRSTNDRIPFSINSLLIAILIYLIQILVFRIFEYFLSTPAFFLLRKTAIFLSFWLKEHSPLIKKNSALFFAPANVV